MTTQNTNSLPFVKTPAGSRIPKIGTLAYHASIGFCDVIGRVGERVRVLVTDFSEATPVSLRKGAIDRKAWMARVANASDATALGGERVRIRVSDFSEATDAVLGAGTPDERTISRSAWLERVADACDDAALAECSHLDARSADERDALYQARPLVRQLQESVLSRCRAANEMLVSIDNAEASGWEFDEYLVERPASERKRGKAPAPRPFKKPASNVGTLEDPTKPDWLVAEMNECFGDMWTPANPERDEAFAKFARENDTRA